MPCSMCLDSINVISVWWLGWDRGEEGKKGHEPAERLYGRQILLLCSWG